LFCLMIEAQQLIKSYNSLKVLKGVSLKIEKGEVISIVGASGAGKSTLLHILGTLDQPDQGKLFINNTDVFSLKSKAISAFRNKEIGFIFQFHHLLPEFTALENILIPGMIAGKTKKELEDKALNYLDILGLVNRKNHKPSELSGGEQQRVAVCRALINSPSVIFADEPSGNLDSASSKELHQLFFDLRDQFNQTFVIVTHNKELANMADRKLEIVDGIIAS
jgi:lipoprotein-releasing system ATP-binding protein